MVIDGDSDLLYYSVVTMVEDLNGNGEADVLAVGFRFSGTDLVSSVIDVFFDIGRRRTGDTMAVYEADKEHDLRAEVAGGWGYAHGAAVFETSDASYLCLGLANHTDIGGSQEGAVVLIDLERLSAPEANLYELLLTPDPRPRAAVGRRRVWLHHRQPRRSAVGRRTF